MTEGGVLVLSGPPGAGKSSVGRMLAATWSTPQHRSVHVEVDALFALLLPASDRSRGDRMFAYEAAHAVARLVVGRGETVVLECTYARIEQRASLLAALAETPATPLWAVEFFVTPDEAVRRFRERHEATDLDERLVRERAARFPYSDQPLRVDSAAAAPGELARQITDWWRRRPEELHRETWAATGRGWD